ncbi:hypothetical protein JIN85_03295 [Luteolibacter pohnpeiensis]|uniref:Teneurin-like YD-shell domain-containing protein n=1 Tax=Luteolibacter pohnpeiensis TaxID=454153 RepID=A0A934S1C0_9BACT|nr:RHS repeat-associated core domain-containing protein [Luteolibacter pohnpeiensis]MBK1881425.1 hypothetical protein [Luteolibacter pohnpeiensis]
MTTSTAAQSAGVSYRKLLFTSDWMGRRVRKQVFTSSTATTPSEDLRFVYDGWNLFVEYTVSTSAVFGVKSSYGWGLDLSGTEQGAGGVGGLRAVATASGSYVPCYDGNGNVVSWVECQNLEQVVTRQEYDPFGNITVHEGLDFPIGFSTKYQDKETGLLYYGYRYYDPVTGRWPSRDPIEERGGVNLYGFVRNDGVNEVDELGLVIQAIQVGDVPGHPPDVVEKDYEMQLVQQSNADAAAFEKMITDMSDDDFKKITKNGITIILRIDENGKTLKEPKMIIVHASKQDVLKWAGYEKTSSYAFIQESDKLTLDDVKNAAMKLKGNKDYEYDSFGLVIHGLPGRGVRLSANHRGTHANAEKIVDSAELFEFKALISCGAPPWEEYVSPYLTRFYTDGWDVEKCTPTFTPAQIGFSLEGKNPSSHQ